MRVREEHERQWRQEQEMKEWLGRLERKLTKVRVTCGEAQQQQ